LAPRSAAIAAGDLAVELVAPARVLARATPTSRLLQLGGLVQRPGRVGEVRAGDGAQVGAAGGDDAVDLVGVR
jgi:hypothetical protein